MKRYRDEAELVTAMRAGDEQAFAYALDTLSPILIGVVIAYVPSRAVAEEVVQETWIAVMRGLEGFEGRSSLKTWIIRILTNIATRGGGREARSVPFSSLAGAGDEQAPSVDPAPEAGIQWRQQLCYGAGQAIMASCQAFRSRMSLRKRTPCCASAPRRRASRCRRTYAAGSSTRRAPRPSRRSWIGREGGPAARSRSPQPQRHCGRIVLVVDASVLAPALADDGPDGDGARARLRGESLVAPELIDLETASVIRHRFRAGHLDPRRAGLALTDLVELPLRRAPHRPLLGRCWELRQNLTVYDAAYIALAEVLDVVMLTADARLAKVPGTRCEIELIES